MKIKWKSSDESLLENIRSRRASECYPIINRGGLWYDMLTEQEKTELLEWYHAWLNATETLIIPEKPTWLT